MRKLLVILLPVAVVLGSGCERHPASATVPGYAEKQKKAAKEEKKAEKTSERVDPNAPQFFPTPAQGH